MILINFWRHFCAIGRYRIFKKYTSAKYSSFFESGWAVVCVENSILIGSLSRERAPMIWSLSPYEPRYPAAFLSIVALEPLLAFKLIASKMLIVSASASRFMLNLNFHKNPVWIQEWWQLKLTRLINPRPKTDLADFLTRSWHIFSRTISKPF